MKRAIACALMFSLASCGSVAPSPVQPAAPAAAPATEATRASTYVRESRYVPVRDGVRLAVNIYRPARDGIPVAEKRPVIFAFTPYRARFRDEKGEVTEAGLSDKLGLKQLLDHGYVVAVADIRGKGASFGSRRGFQDRTEALDGRDLIQWLAAQPWSTGKVGMTGCSYLGGSTVHVASTAPPALKAIFAGATDIDKYAFVRRGGIPAQFNTRPDEPLEVDLASLPVDADPDGAMLKEAVAQHAANTPMAALWYSMPFRDSKSPLTGNAFWQEAGPYTYLPMLKASGIATYFWGTWQDEPVEQVILAAHNLGGRLLVGPGSHCEPTTGVNLADEMIAFFDHHLMGVDTGITRQPRHTFYIDDPKGEGRWIRSETSPMASAGREALMLSAASGGAGPTQFDGSLTAGAQPAGRAGFTVDYDVGKGEYFPFWVTPQGAKGASFTGPALKAERVLLGSAVARLKVSVDRADAHVFAYLEDVAPDGKSEVVSFGRLRASQRLPAQAPYEVFDLPWQSGLSGDARPLTPGQPVMMELALTPTGRLIHAGHRLRLVVTGADPRQRNLADIKETPPPRITLHLGGADGSRIELPLVDPAEVGR